MANNKTLTDNAGGIIYPLTNADQVLVKDQNGDVFSLASAMDAVSATLATKMDKGYLKDEYGQPTTTLFNKTGLDLDNEIQADKDDLATYKEGIETGSVIVYEATHITGPEDAVAGKYTRKDYAGLMEDVESKAQNVVSGTASEIYDYIDDKIEDLVVGNVDVTIPVATAPTGQGTTEPPTNEDGTPSPGDSVGGIYGRTRLASLADLAPKNEEDPSLASGEFIASNDYAVAITPYVLHNYLFGNDEYIGKVGSANGIASLDDTGKLPTSQLPGSVDAIVEYDSISDFPAEGEGGKIYVDKSNGKSYRWSGTQYIEISASLALGETAGTAYEGNKGAATTDKVNRILEGTLVVPQAGNANLAANAERDQNGKVIDTTYATKSSVNEIDGRNYLRFTDGSSTGDVWVFDTTTTGRPANTFAYLTEKQKLALQGKYLTVSFSWEAENATLVDFIGFSFWVDYVDGTHKYVECAVQPADIVSYTGRGIKKVTVKLEDKEISNFRNHQRAFYGSRLTSGTFKVWDIKFNAGEYVSGWQPALEDEVAWRNIIGLHYRETTTTDRQSYE